MERVRHVDPRKKCAWMAEKIGGKLRACLPLLHSCMYNITGRIGATGGYPLPSRTKKVENSSPWLNRCKRRATNRARGNDPFDDAGGTDGRCEEYESAFLFLRNACVRDVADVCGRTLRSGNARDRRSKEMPRGTHANAPSPGMTRSRTIVMQERSHPHSHIVDLLDIPHESVTSCQFPCETNVFLATKLTRRCDEH